MSHDLYLHDLSFASPCTISQKSDNRLLSYDQKSIFNMAAVRHIAFNFFLFLVTWLLFGSKSAVVHQSSSTDSLNQR